MRFDKLEPPRTSAYAPCSPCCPCNDVAREGSKRFGELEPPRTNARQHCRGNKVYRVLMHSFGVVHVHRTSSNYSNHNTTEIARCGEVCHISSGWFDCTEPPLNPTLSYIILPPLTTANHSLPCRTFLPHPTLYSTAILPHIQPSPTLSYPI